MRRTWRWAGSGLNHEGLLAALEGFRDFERQLTPRVTPGPDRRVGIRGALIVSLVLAGLTFVPASDWVEAD